MSTLPRKKILMVCLGNICRSPIAEGVMQMQIEKHGLNWQVDSAGTSGFHNGERPDRRSIEVAQKHQIDITNQRSRQIMKSDLEEYDHILAMDSSNYRDILSLPNASHYKDKVELLLNYSQPGFNKAVPDPYYEGGFEGVFHMIEKP
jgi:protein-tyrosine phosphatase